MQSPASTESSEGGGAALGSPSAASGSSASTATAKTMDFNALVPYIPGGRPAQATFNEVRIQCARAQEIIMRLQQATNNQVGLPSPIRDKWFDELKQIAQCFISAQQSNSKVEQLVNTEKAQLQGALQAALSERDVLIAQKNSAAQEVDILRSRLGRQNFSGTVDGTKSTAADLEQFQRSLHAKCQDWISEQENNADTTGMSCETPRARPPGLASNYVGSSSVLPPASPTPMRSARTLNYNSMNKLNQHLAMLDFDSSGPNQSYKPPVTPLSRRAYNRTDQTKLYGALPAPAPNQAQYGGYVSTPAHGAYNTLQTYYAGPPSSRRGTGSSGSYTSSSNSGTDVASLCQTASSLVGLNPDTAGPLSPVDSNWNQQFFEVFTMVLGWVTTYCNEVNPLVTRQLGRATPKLWEYILHMTYPDNMVNAASHASHMLNDEKLRRCFIARLLIQYIVQQMWNPKFWEGLNDDLTENLAYIQTRLARVNGYDAVVTPQERHVLVTQRAQAISTFLHHPSWPRIKRDVVNTRTARFRDILGPLMNPGVDRNAANHDLSVICDKCVRVSAQVNGSALSFQFLFNDCGNKFSEGSHFALNSTLPPRELQIKHWRIMVVVTPGITYRNDAGVSVDPRFISKANVLVMH